MKLTSISKIKLIVIFLIIICSIVQFYSRKYHHQSVKKVSFQHKNRKFDLKARKISDVTKKFQNVVANLLTKNQELRAIDYSKLKNEFDNKRQEYINNLPFYSRWVNNLSQGFSSAKNYVTSGEAKRREKNKIEDKTTFIVLEKIMFFKKIIAKYEGKFFLSEAKRYKIAYFIGIQRAAYFRHYKNSSITSAIEKMIQATKKDIDPEKLEPEFKIFIRQLLFMSEQPFIKNFKGSFYRWVYYHRLYFNVVMGFNEIFESNHMLLFKDEKCFCDGDKQDISKIKDFNPKSLVEWSTLLNFDRKKESTFSAIKKEQIVRDKVKKIQDRLFEENEFYLHTNYIYKNENIIIKKAERLFQITYDNRDIGLFGKHSIFSKLWTQIKKIDKFEADKRYLDEIKPRLNKIILKIYLNVGTSDVIIDEYLFVYDKISKIFNLPNLLSRSEVESDLSDYHSSLIRNSNFFSQEGDISEMLIAAGNIAATSSKDQNSGYTKYFEGQKEKIFEKMYEKFNRHAIMSMIASDKLNDLNRTPIEAIITTYSIPSYLYYYYLHRQKLSKNTSLEIEELVRINKSKINTETPSDTTRDKTIKQQSDLDLVDEFNILYLHNNELLADEVSGIVKEFEDEEERKSRASQSSSDSSSSDSSSDSSKSSSSSSNTIPISTYGQDHTPEEQKVIDTTSHRDDDPTYSGN